MNMKRILVLVMTFAMLISTFAPTLGVFADYVAGNGDNGEDGTLDYVSLGDSMTNGIGMEGYDDKNQNGYLEVAPDAYPAKIAAWLAGYLGEIEAGQTEYEGSKGKVNLTQLATSAVRAEDVYYILNHGTENAFEPDIWTTKELINRASRWGRVGADSVAETYQNAVANADVISLSVGNGNYGVYLVGRLMGIAFNDTDELEEYAHMNFENALLMCEADAEVEEFVVGIYNDLLAYLEGMNLPMELVELVLDRVIYVTTSLVITYNKLLDTIVEINEQENLEIIILPLINNLAGFGATVVDNDGNETVLDFGAVLDMIYTPLNAYFAALPTAKQAAGEYEGVTLYYAEYIEGVETFAQASKELYVPISEGVDDDTYPGDRYFSHTRFISDIAGWVFNTLGLKQIISYNFGAYGINYVDFTADDVKRYEIAKANNDLTTLMGFSYSQLLSMGIYLGFVDAILASMETNHEFNPADIVLADGAEPNAMSYIGAIALEPLTGAFKTVGEGLAGGDASAMINVPATFSTALTSSGALKTLLSLYGRMKMADGLNSHPTASGHDTITDSIINAYEENYTVQDETVENAKEALILALKATDEAYQYGYDYVDNAGYIDNAVAVLDKVIARLELVDLSDNGPMTEEFKAEMHEEIDAMIATLTEIKNALANDDAEDLEGLVATLYALLDDVLVHLSNVYDILAQAGIDVNQLVIIPALKEALEIIETELIPALEQLVEEFIDAVVAHVTEKAEALYSYALGLTKEAYEALVEVIVRIQLHVEEKVDEIIDTVLDQYFAVLEQLTEIYGDVEYALNIVIEVYRAVADFVAEHGDEIVDGLEIAKVVFVTVYDFLVEHGEDVKVAFEVAVKVYTAVVEFVVANAEDIEKALEIAGKAFDYVLEAAKYVYENAEEIYAIASEVYATLVEVIVKVNSAVETAIDVYNYVYDLLVDIFGSIENAACIAKKVCALVVEFIKNTPEMLENAYQLFLEIYDVIVEAYGYSNDALEAANAAYKYVLCVLTAVSDDIKDAIYNAENADYTITENSYYVALGNAAYAEELAEMLYLEGKFAQYGLAGDYTADLENADLVTVKFNNGEFYQFAYTQVVGTVAGLVRSNALVMEYYELYSDVVDAALAEYGLSINTEAQELDWSKYMDAETLAIFEDRLDAAAAQLVAAGFPEVYALDLTDVISAQLPAGFVVEEDIVIEIPVAELIVYAVENALYAYAETVGRVVNTLAEIYEVAPEATVVITGINNSTLLFADLVAGFAPEAVEYVVALDDAVELLNLPLYAYAVLNENTIFVNSDNAEDIYAALHAHCAHAYDDCADTVCNICGETRVAPGHVWGEWVTVEEATTEKEGTAERTCEVCGATETKSIDKLPVDDDNQGGDNTGDDNKGEDNTQTPVVDDEKGGLAPWAIVAISVGSVAVACGAGALVYWFVIKKKKA